jgi:hypothetical protein
VIDVERTKFLQLCQQVSVLKIGICGVKENVPDELKVVHNGIVYYPVAYQLSFDKGQTKHIALLHDLNANSLTQANLERVSKYEQERSYMAYQTQ